MNMHTLPGATANVTPNLQRFLARLNRSQVEAVAQAAIDLLDELDGDADLEPTGDEADGLFSEDDFGDFAGWGPGCPVSDPAGEREESHCGVYGVNQSERISDNNPAIY